MARIIVILQILLIGLWSCSKETDITNSTNNNSNTPTPTTPTTANQLVFSGTTFSNNGAYPKLYTCDSSGFSPALQWSKEPAGTKSYVITMHHYPPTYPTEDKHVYFVLYNIPSGTNSLPANSKTIGNFGINTVNRKNEYTPPCSQGPGAKTYILTLYALSDQPSITTTATQTTMDVVLAGIRNRILDSAVMNVTYTR